MISVIIPTYGTPKFLKKAIQSVIDQTYYEWELIVVDDNNPDTSARIETEKIMEFFKDSRIKYTQHPHNKNGAAARNTALNIARGEYISFLDSDDEYLPTRLQKCKTAMDNSAESIGGVYTGCEFRRKGKTYYRFTKPKDGNHLLNTLSCTFMLGTGSNLFVRKKVLDQLNGFDESFLRHQDYEFLARFFQKYSIRAIPEVLVIKNNENFNLPNVKKMISIKNQYLSKFKSVIDTLETSEISRIYHTNYISIAELALRDKNRAVAKKYYSMASEYESLSCIEILRRIALSICNIL